jgi:hypothetical protein
VRLAHSGNARQQLRGIEQTGGAARGPHARR